MAVGIKVVKQGCFPEDLANNIRVKFTTLKKGIRVLGDDTRDHLITIIKTNKKRKEADNKPDYMKLENSIKVYSENNGDTVGIGKIAYLDSVSPHWYIINHGGLSGVAKAGKMVPGYFGNFNPPISQYKGTGLGREAFYYVPNTYAMATDFMFFMKPESPIRPMHYIERTKAWLRTVIKVHFYNYTKETKVTTKKLQIV